MHVYMYVCISVCKYVFMYVYMYGFIYVCIYLCMYVFMYVCMYVCMYEWMNVGTKLRPSIFFSENIITIVMKSAYSMGAAITNLRLFFHKISFHMNTLYPRLPQRLYASHWNV
jgi:hypothetical protein